jgi:catalase
VADGLGMLGPIKAANTTVAARTDLAPSPALSILAKAKPGNATKIIGCLVADGTDANEVIALRDAAAAQGATVKIVAPKIGGAKAKGKGIIEADFQLAGGPSVLFDAVFVALSAEGAEMLSTEAAAVAWVHDAFAHLKVIGATAGADALLKAAGVVPDKGVLVAGDSKPYLKAVAAGRIWDREPAVRTIF